MDFPNGDWTTRDKCIDDCEESYYWAEVSYNRVVNQLSSTVAAINAIEDGATKQACTKLYTLTNDLRKAVKYLIASWPEHDIDYNVPYFFKYYTSTGDVEITWKNIVSAWIDADLTGRLWTVATLDELRKEAWDQPFEGIYIKAGTKPE